MHGYIAQITAGKNAGGRFVILTNFPTEPCRYYSYPDERFFLVRQGLIVPAEADASAFDDKPRRTSSYFRGSDFDACTRFVYSQWGEDDIPVVLEFAEPGITRVKSHKLPTTRLDELQTAAMVDMLTIATSKPKSPKMGPTLTPVKGEPPHSWLG